MKAIIIAGVSLFAAATIYGVTDFAADKKSGTIDKLYKEEAATAEEENKTAAIPAAVKEEKTPAAVATENTVKKSTAKKKLRRYKAPVIREVKFSDFSRGRIRPKEVKQEVLVESLVTENKE